MIPLPQDTRSILKAHARRTDNLFLRYYRYVDAWEPGWKLEGQQKAGYLAGLARQSGAHAPRAAHDALAAYLCRLRAMLDSLRASGLWTVRCLDLTTHTRLVAGLGYKGALETGLTLHPLYGFPYLPGTSVKGVTRAWAQDVLLPQGAVSAAQLKVVFGTEDKYAEHAQQDTKRMGTVRFLDAVPTGFPRLELDVMTPHAQPYYDNPDATPPATWHDPVPVTFLTVAPGSSFLFPLVARKEENEQTAKDAEAWLEAGLDQLGIGGKTSADYGYLAAPGEGLSLPMDWDDITFYKAAYQPGEKRTKATENTILPARVVGRVGRALLVELHVEDTLLNNPGKPLQLGGINPASFKEGNWVGVYPQLTRRRKIHGVQWATADTSKIPL